MTKLGLHPSWTFLVLFGSKYPVREKVPKSEIGATSKVLYTKNPNCAASANLGFIRFYWLQIIFFFWIAEWCHLATAHKVKVHPCESETVCSVSVTQFHIVGTTCGVSFAKLHSFAFIADVLSTNPICQNGQTCKYEKVGTIRNFCEFWKNWTYSYSLS